MRVGPSGSCARSTPSASAGWKASRPPLAGDIYRPSSLRARMPSQHEAICNVTAEQLSPERVRIAVMECTDSDDSKRAAALKARMQRRGDGLATTQPLRTTTSQLLSTSTSQHATGAGGAAPSRGRSKRTGSCSTPSEGARAARLDPLPTARGGRDAPDRRHGRSAGAAVGVELRGRLGLGGCHRQLKSKDKERAYRVVRVCGHC